MMFLQGPLVATWNHTLLCWDVWIDACDLGQCAKTDLDLEMILRAQCVSWIFWTLEYDCKMLGNGPWSYSIYSIGRSMLWYGYDIYGDSHIQQGRFPKPRLFPCATMPGETPCSWLACNSGFRNFHHLATGCLGCWDLMHGFVVKRYPKNHCTLQLEGFEGPGSSK